MFWRQITNVKRLWEGSSSRTVDMLLRHLPLWLLIVLLTTICGYARGNTIYRQWRQKSGTLHIGGIFPMRGAWAGGKGCRPAVDIALEDINDRKDLLPNFKLEMLAHDSRVFNHTVILTITRGQSNLTKAPHGGPIPRLGVTPGGRKLYHWIPGVGFPISVP